MFLQCYLKLLQIGETAERWRSNQELSTDRCIILLRLVLQNNICSWNSNMTACWNDALKDNQSNPYPGGGGQCWSAINLRQHGNPRNVTEVLHLLTALLNLRMFALQVFGICPCDHRGRDLFKKLLEQAKSFHPLTSPTAAQGSKA